MMVKQIRRTSSLFQYRNLTDFERYVKRRQYKVQHDYWNNDMSAMTRIRRFNTCEYDPAQLSSNFRIVFQATLHIGTRRCASFTLPSPTLSKDVNEIFVLQIRHIIKGLVSNATSSFPIIDRPTLLMGKFRGLGHRQVHHIC